MKVETMISQWQQALSIEAEEGKKEGGTKYLLMNGTCIAANKESYYYLFVTPFQIAFPDDTPISVFHHGTEYSGTVVSSLGSKILIHLSAYIGKQVQEIEITSAPWELLYALQDRLQEIKGYKEKKKQVFLLLTGKAPVKHKAYGGLKELLHRAWYNKTTYIWGPPGTGKTYHLARVATHQYKQKKRVLVLAHSNAAVDVLLNEIATISAEQWQPGEIIRYGFSSSPAILRHPTLLSHKLAAFLHPELEEEMELEALPHFHQEKQKQQQQRRKIEQQLISEAYIIGTTLSKIAIDRTLYEQFFDLVIVDEASMATTPQIAFAATLGKKVVVCGDFKQLPPIAISNHELVNRWLKEDIFHHGKIAQAIEKKEQPPHLFVLTKQRRMHPDISRFTNHYIYHDYVSDHSSVAERQKIADYPPFPQEAVTLVDVKGIALRDVQTESRFNVLSALATLKMVQQALDNGVTSIGIVTPYKAQARLINTMIQENIQQKNIIAATVHKFQGSERDMILFDTVDSFPQARPGMLFTNKDQERLVNVALTRSRGKCITFMDESYMKARLGDTYALSAWRKYLPLRSFRHEKNTSAFLQDIHQAKERIVISETEDIWSILEQKRTQLIVSVLSQKDVPLSSYDKIYRNIYMPIVIIDGHILWYNQTYRYEGKEMITLLLRYMNIQLGKQNKKYQQNKLLSIRTDYSFSTYIDTWIRCPYCNSKTKEQENNRLQCTYCGSILRITIEMMQKYIDYVNLACPTCHRAVEAIEKNNGIHIHCATCEQDYKMAY